MMEMVTGMSGRATFVRRTSLEPFAVRCKSFGRNNTVALKNISPSSAWRSPLQYAASSVRATAAG